jgi:DNA mismatch repair ATPase MutS
MGKVLMKQWFFRPLLNIEEIRERQAVVGILSHPRFAHVQKTIVNSLKQIKNIPVLPTHASKF